MFLLHDPITLHVFATKEKNKERKNTKNAKNDDDDALAILNRIYSKKMYKWIMNLKAIKHMTSHRAVIDTYEMITLRNIHLDDDSVI